LAERLAAAQGDRDDITRLTRLAFDLGSDAPALQPYLEGSGQDG
jgi:hypothetical protein